MAAPVFPTPVKASMEILPESSPLRLVYPENLYPNGNYYPSPFGRVRYWIMGPSDGKKIVLIHGISFPSWIFSKLAPALASSGFQVLLYDHYGRGYSEAPQGIPYDPNLYITQLALLLQYIRWDTVKLVGLSMGGAVAAAFSSMFPHLVNDGVVFIAAAGMMDLPKPQWSRSPNEALMCLTEQKQSQNCIAALGPHPTRASLPNLQAAYLPGFEEASASSSREGILSEVHWAYEALGKSTDKRFLIFHGTGDFVVPYDHALKIKNFIPQAELITIKTSSHALVLEPGVWEDVTRRIIAFFP